MFAPTGHRASRQIVVPVGSRRLCWGLVPALRLMPAETARPSLNTARLMASELTRRSTPLSRTGGSALSETAVSTALAPQPTAAAMSAAYVPSRSAAARLLIRR